MMGFMTSSNIDVKSQTKENGMLEKALHFLKVKKKTLMYNVLIKKYEYKNI